MPKETSDTTKPKVTRSRRKKVEESESISAVETAPEAVSKPRRRVTKPKTTKKKEMAETELEVEAEETTSAPARKAPTVNKEDVTNLRSGIKVSRHWYAMALIALTAFGGAAYIGSQDRGAIDVDILMAERRRALNEERAARSVPVQNQAAAVTAFENQGATEIASSSEETTSLDDAEIGDTNSTSSEQGDSVQEVVDTETPVEPEGVTVESSESVAN